MHLLIFNNKITSFDDVRSRIDLSVSCEASKEMPDEAENGKLKMKE